MKNFYVPTTRPTKAITGDLYYDTKSNEMKVFVDNRWRRSDRHIYYRNLVNGYIWNSKKKLSKFTLRRLIYAGWDDNFQRVLKLKEAGLI